MERYVHALPIQLIAGIAFVLYVSSLWLVFPLEASHQHGALISDNSLISQPDAIPRRPAIAIDHAGTAYAAWNDARTGPAGGIYVARKPASTAWATPTQIPGSNAGHPSAPTIAAGAPDTVYVAWVDGFPDARADVRFALSADGGVTWSEPARVNTDAGDIAGHPDLAVDAQGSVHLVWSDLATFGDSHSRDVKWSMRSAGQEAWGAPAVVHPDVEVLAEQSQPAVAADGAGNVYAIWEDARHGPDDAHAIYAARLAVGETDWEVSRRVDHRSGGFNAHPDIAVTPDGAVHAVWDDGGAGAVYSAVLRPDAVGWDGPLRVSDEEATAASPRLAVDARGIAFAVWQDNRNGNLDLYSAVRWPGSLAWSDNRRLNDDAGDADQEVPSIAADGAGRAVAVWIDRRHASPEVYAAELHLTVYEARLPLLLGRQ